MRTIDFRRAAVAGIDLEQALNYIMLSDVGYDFLYDKYTAGRLLYTPGSRPRLEELVRHITRESVSPREGVCAIARFIPENLPHATGYMDRTGNRLAADRNLCEEELLDSGYAWCNEQARLFCALTQIYGVMSRLVFIFMPEGESGGGHVVSEVLLPEGWMAVDQTIGFCFIDEADHAVAAADVCNRPENRKLFADRYREAFRRMAANYQLESIRSCCALALADEPLNAYRDIGIHNYFLL